MRVSEPRLRAIFRRIDVTPSYPVSLLGYFNDRLSEGVLDPLHCRLAAFLGTGGRAARLLFVQIDSCLFDQAFAWSLGRALGRRECGAWGRDEVLVRRSLK